MLLQQHQHCVNLWEENLFSDNQNRVLLLHGSLYVFALMLRFSFEVIHLRKPTSKGLSNEFRNYFRTPDQLIHLRSWSFTSMTHSACQIIKLLYKFETKIVPLSFTSHIFRTAFVSLSSLCYASNIFRIWRLLFFRNYCLD
jgi:hypothetical protein